MKFDVLTLFPEMFDCLNQSVIGRAVEKELIDINYLLEEIIGNFKPILEADNIALEFDEDEETYMLADYNRLSQVIVNVVKNSMEAVRNRGNSYIKVYTEKTKNNIIIFSWSIKWQF